MNINGGYAVKPTEDPNHKGNSSEYHTGKPCIVKGCKEPAGTWWGPSWCRQHNHERLERIGSNLADMVKRAELREAVEKETDGLRKMLYSAYAEMHSIIVAVGGRVTVLPEHRTAKITAQSKHTPQGDKGPATYRYDFEIQS